MENAEKGSRKEAPRFKHCNHWNIVYDERFIEEGCNRYIYVDDQLLNTFFSYMNIESRNGSNKSLLSINCYTTYFLTKLFQEDEKFDYTKVARWCRKMRRADQKFFLKALFSFQ
jgi:hypothetical protein